jgi:hypothetical protein
MSSIRVHEMIITCEACGNVKRYPVKSEANCDTIFKGFSCENNCGRSLLSYITVGALVREDSLTIAEDSIGLAMAN